jgi:2-polyprenyl-3-methyl-5-hydroxy-6-metoxy-1,4-benzoquinol methylase
MAPDRARQPTFTRDRLARISQIERWHFWFAGRQALLECALTRYVPDAGSRLLDVGCGTGHVLDLLTRSGYRALGLDLRREGLRAYAGTPRPALLVQAEATRCPLPQGTFDAVLLLDVLEHVEAPDLIREVHRLLKPAGWALLSVPAMDWLWSYRDLAAGHIQRFSRKRLTDLMVREGMHPVELRYYQFFLFPLVAVSRLLARRFHKMRDLEEARLPLLNELFAAINRLEVRLGDTIPWPWGSSIFAVFRKGSSR